jgi:hypothetical protein
MTKEKMIELCNGQLEAYNNRNIDQFCSYYHNHVEAYRYSTTDRQFKLLFKGIHQFKESYQKMFANSPNLHCHLASRIVLNDTVMDEEKVTGRMQSAEASHVVASYKFSDNLISQIYFF